MTVEPVLQLHGYGVAFAERVVLADVSLEIPVRGFFPLVGPSGSGKSALLRNLAGLDDAHPERRTWGDANFRGRSLSLGHSAPVGEARPGMGLVTRSQLGHRGSVRERLVSALPLRGSAAPKAQTTWVEEILTRHGLWELVRCIDDDASCFTQSVQRRLAIVRALVSEPAFLLIDEVTADLDERAVVDVLELVRFQALQRAVLFVADDRRLGRAPSDRVIHLAEGRVIEKPNPSSEDPRAAPRGFFWVQEGMLAGLPRPGMVDPIERDLERLSRLGVTTLVTLETTSTVPLSLLERFGITSIHLPIADMEAPDIASGESLARNIDRRLSAGEGVAVHCRGGVGRTGTILAAQLVFGGAPARVAIERVRQANPASLPSRSQIGFLSAFEKHVRNR